MRGDPSAIRREATSPASEMPREEDELEAFTADVESSVSHATKPVLAERRRRVRVASNSVDIPTCLVTDAGSNSVKGFIEDISLGGISMRVASATPRFDIGDGVTVEIRRGHDARKVRGEVVWITMAGEPVRAVGVKWTDASDGAFLQSYLDALIAAKR